MGLDPIETIALYNGECEWQSLLRRLFHITCAPESPVGANKFKNQISVL
jgi:hypothetical protein